jgi:hypothetical protein
MALVGIEYVPGKCRHTSGLLRSEDARGQSTFAQRQPSSDLATVDNVDNVDNVTGCVERRYVLSHASSQVKRENLGIRQRRCSA